LQMERAKQGWVIGPNEKPKVKTEVKNDDPVPRKPTKLEETRDAFIALARKFPRHRCRLYILTGVI
jgi:hypothetical protein